MKVILFAYLAALASAIPHPQGMDEAAAPEDESPAEIPAAAPAPAKGSGKGGAPKGIPKGKGSSGGKGKCSSRGGGGGGASGGSTQNELLNGSCKAITLIFARASTEPGNMGMSMGPATCSGLKRNYPGKVACQGVGRPYTAGLAENVSASGTSAAAIGEATKMFTTASTKCPNTVIVFGGYSQGTAVMMNAVKGLSADVKKKVVGGVLFGYTKNAQTKGSIPNYPKNQVIVFCNEKPAGSGKFADGVCGGKLNVNGGHFAYMGNGDGGKAVTFLKSKIDPALKG